MLVQHLFLFLLIVQSLVQGSAVIRLRAAPPQSSTDQTDDDNACPNYEICSSKGLIYYNDLTTTLANHSAIDRSDGLKLFEKYYGPEYDQSVPVWPSMTQSFQNRQMNPDNLDVWEVNSRDPATGERDRAMAYYNTFGTHAGVLVAENNWRSSDQQKKLPWSEIVYQTWQVAAAHADALAAEDAKHPPGGPISNLRSVVRHNIVNEGTKAVVTAAYSANGWKIGEDEAEQWREWTEVDTPSFFYGLLGTDNVKGVLWLLKDHAVELGRKEITTIWTRWHEVHAPDIW
ncbi:MAG: hypothetical protein LQ350_006718 [Teloschistes chrysophthalmus]|nr:MAG: hypothetical protein LQ350_006718 [Niorma chrysophthalma]